MFSHIRTRACSTAMHCITTTRDHVCDQIPLLEASHACYLVSTRLHWHFGCIGSSTRAIASFSPFDKEIETKVTRTDGFQ